MSTKARTKTSTRERRSKHPVTHQTRETVGSGTTTYYSIADYTVYIDNDGYMYAARRSDGQKYSPVNLNQVMGKVVKQTGADSFAVIGVDEPIDSYISTTGLNDNSVFLTEDGKLSGIGTGKPVSIAEYSIQIILEDGDLYFYEQAV